MDGKPVYILTGYLGAGKTTLMQNLLRDQKEDGIMLLVNELSPFSLDKKLVSLHPDRIVDLSGGCACCNLRKVLMGSLQNAVRREDIDRIFIEATGVALPGQMMDMALQIEGTSWGGAVTVVDASAFLRRQDDRKLMEDQIGQADLVLINKTDLTEEEELNRVKESVAGSLRPGAKVVSTSFARISMEELHGLLSTVEPAPRTAGFCNTVAGRYDTLLFIAKGRVDTARLEEELHHEGIVRAKGLIPEDGRNTLLQLAGSRVYRSEYGGELSLAQMVVIVRCPFTKEVENRIRPLFEAENGG